MQVVTLRVRLVGEAHARLDHSHLSSYYPGRLLEVRSVIRVPGKSLAPGTPSPIGATSSVRK